MPYWQPVFFKYADSGRAAIGLTVEAWRGTTFLRSRLTDGQGYAGDYYTGERLVIKRGVHKFAYEPVIPDASYSLANHYEILPEHWPQKLKDLRELLTEEQEGGGTAKSLLIDAANRALQALSGRGDLDQLTVPTQFSKKTKDDNPLIIIGALLPSMAISRLFTIDEGTRKYYAETPNAVERDRLHSIKTGIHHALLWLRQRQHPLLPGYFLRWQQAEPDGRNTENDWKAEPSLDEYSGLLLGLSWLYQLAEYYNFGAYNQWSSSVTNETTSMLGRISDYLVDTQGWLVRPGKGDLTVRGPDLVANAYPLFLTLRNFGYWAFRNAKPFDLISNEKKMVDRSAQSLEMIVQSQPGSLLAKTYKDSVDLAQTIKDINSATDIVQWAGAVVGALGLAFGLFGFAFLGAAIYLGASYLEDKAVEMLDFDVWDLAGEMLGPPCAVDAGGYNVYIFDRFCLAASWAADIVNFEAFAKRAKRPFGGDGNGWRSLSIGARVWMGVDIKPKTIKDELLIDVDALMPNDGSLPNPGRRTFEGFVMGWSMIALALDLDPEIRWEECVTIRNDWDAPVEIPTTVLPRFRMIWERLLVNETREHGDVYKGEEPYLWIIPVVLTERQTSFSYHILPTYERSFTSADTGDTFCVNETLDWGIEPIEVTTHILVASIAWEADFTSLSDKRRALADALASVETELNLWIPYECPVGELAERIQAMLQCQLPHYYRNAEAQPGYRQSDDDFVGASVIHLSADRESIEFQQEFVIHLYRDPKPRPLFTDLTLEATINFKNLV